MTDTLREAAEYILDGMGIDGPDYTVDPDDEYLDAANSKWVKETLSRLAAALAAAPQPAPVDRDACRAKQAEPDRGSDETPYDRGYVWGYRHGLRNGKAEVAPQPVPDREALVDVLRPYVGAGMAHAIADALLARGLRLPGDAEAERDALQGQLNDLRNGWANSVKAHADALAERDAAFAAGQEEMRGRAGKAVLRALYKPVGSATEAERHMDDNMVARGVYEAIRALPIKPRP